MIKIYTNKSVLLWIFYFLKRQFLIADQYVILGDIWVDVTRVGDYAYVWGDGNSLPSKGTGPWHNDKPDGNNECARLLYMSQKYAIDDRACNNNFAFLCEI